MNTANLSIVCCAMVLVTTGAASQQAPGNLSSKLTDGDTILLADGTNSAFSLKPVLLLPNGAKPDSQESKPHTAQNTTQEPYCMCSTESGQRGAGQERGESTHAPDK